MNKRPAYALALVLLAGCGGGGGSSSVPASQAKAQAKTIKGSVILSIPTSGASNGSAKVRYPQFVSPSASSVALSVNGAADQLFDVSPTSAICTTAGGSRNCTLSFGAPVGADTFAFLIFQGANGTGAQLASATATQAIAAGTAFDFTVALNAVIGTIVVNIPSHGGSTCQNAPSSFNGIAEGCAGNAAPATIVAYDPSGAAITGTAPYATPITISATDPSLSASPATITAPGQTSTLSYTGAPFAAGVTSTITVNLTVGTQIIPVSVGVLRSYLYVANSNAPIGSTPAGGGNVAIYTFGATGNASPVHLISGSNTQIKTPAKAISDASGNIYVLDNGIPVGPNFNGNILEFNAGSLGTVDPANVFPSASITNMGSLGAQACTDMVFDPTGAYLFVACGTQINVFPITALHPTGNLASNAVSTYLAFESAGTATGLAFDPAGNLYITDDSENQILSAGGPVQTTGGYNGSLGGGPSILAPAGSWNASDSPQSLIFDVSGNLYAPFFFLSPTSGGGDATAELGIWHSASLNCTDCAPSIALTGAPFTTHAYTGIALDPAGNAYVSNAVTGEISEFAAATVNGASAPNPAVLRTLTNFGSGQAAVPIGLWVGP